MPNEIKNQSKNELQELNLCNMLGIESSNLVQLVHSLNKDKIVYPCLAQEKYDGCYCIAHRSKGHVKIFSRTGKQYLSMEHLEQCFEKMLDGTTKDFIIFEAYNPNIIQAEISGACRDTVNQHSEIVAIIHDCLSLPEYFGEVKTSYERRLSDLMMINANYYYPCISLPIKKICFDWQDVEQFAAEIFSRGGEGVVIKNLQANYHRGKRDYTLMKYKQTITFDLRVVDVVEGTGQFKNMAGALVVKFSGNRNINVGTGLTNSQRKLFWLQKDTVIGRIVEVEAMRLTASGLLREPRFKGFRDDKEVADYE